MISKGFIWRVLVVNFLLQYGKTSGKSFESHEWNANVKQHLSAIVKRQVSNADSDSVKPTTTYTDKVCKNEDGSPKDVFTFHDPSKCVSFYFCHHGQLYETKCAPKRAYDTETQECIPAEEVPGCEYVVQLDECEETCLNGGTCIGANVCKCLGNYHGYRCLYMGYSKSIDSEINLEADISGRMCSMFGAGNVVTFDGLSYDFPGTCQYEMVSSAGIPDFKVLVRKNANCTQGGMYAYNAGNCIEKVTVLFAASNIKVTIAPNEVTLNNKIISLPYDGDAVLISRMYPFIVLSLGEMSLKFDRETSTVHVILNMGRYYNKTKGLCGNFNGDRSDDLISKQGVSVTGASTGHIIAKTWIERDVDEVCHDIKTVTEDLAECREEETVTKICNVLWAFFSSCHSVLDPSAFYDLCKTEMCRCDYTKRADCQCEIVTLYSRSCGLAGGTPPAWRSENQCLRGCPGNQEWIECGKESPQSCVVPHLLPNQLCFDRCQCPYGRYEHNRECTVLANCPCIHKGVEYKPGERTSIYNCNNCTCDAGQWKCDSSMCPGTAHVFGFSHFKTFDDRFFTFDGICQYVFAKDCKGQTFTMYLEGAECGSDPGMSCIKTFTIELSLFGQSQKIALKEIFNVRINNYDVELPYHAGDLHIIRGSSLYVYLSHESTGIEVLWNGYDTVFVTVPQKYKGQLCGLAGNYNGNSADDFISSQNILESTPASFGNSWKLNDDCKDIDNTFTDPCQINSDKESSAKIACGRIYKAPFTDCHDDIDPDEYYRNCMYEFCECTKEMNSDCMCDALAVYAQKCTSIGKIGKWRSKHFCGVKCSGGQVFQSCGSGCGKTCRSLSEPEECTEMCVEGCNCPEGMYLSPEGSCVDDKSCPCYNLGIWYQPGQTIHTPGAMCQCIRGHVECEGEGTLPSLCPTGQIYHNCTQQNTFGKKEAKGAECAKTCVNKDLPCPLALCVSGCSCPSGLVWHNERCIKPSLCPCYHNNKQFEHGSNINVDCNECHCSRGSWECTHKSCGGQCSITGESHFKTFDGRWFDFAGDCEYIVATDECGSNMGSFKIFFKSNPCETLGYVCSRTITVQLGANQIILEQGHGPDETTLVESNGVDIQYEISEHGFFTVIQSAIGLNVLWDKATRVYVQLRPSHQGNVCGLCGNFDGDDNNDFLMRSQEVVASSNVFGNNWRLKESCPQSLFEKGVDMCDKYPSRKAWAIRQCKVIMGEAFKSCRNEIDHQKYLDHCLSDTCGCEAGGVCDCFCTSVAAYAHECGQHGILVDWRTPNLCPTMCELYNKNDLCEWHYEVCGTSCPDTCCNRNNQQHCGLPCLEGCHPRCHLGTVYSPENGTCIDENSCGVCPTTTTTTTAPTTTVVTTTPTTTVTTVTTPCPKFCFDQTNNVTRQPGEKWYDSTCSQLECTYFGDECPRISSSTKSCVVSIVCPPYQTKHTITYTNPADDPDPCCEELECVCEPNNVLIEKCPPSPTCNEYENLTPAGTHPDTNKCCRKHECVCKDDDELNKLCPTIDPCKPGYTIHEVESESCCPAFECRCTKCVVGEEEININQEYELDDCVTQVCVAAEEEGACPYLDTYSDKRKFCPVYSVCGRYQIAYEVQYASPLDDPNVCCTEYGCKCDESVLPTSCPQWEDRMKCSKYQEIELKEDQYHDASSCCPVLSCVCKKDLKGICPEWHDMECGEYETKTYLGMSNKTNLCCPMYECVKPPCHDPKGKPFKGEINYLTEDECCTSVCIEEGDDVRMETNCFMPSCSYTCENDYFVPSIGTGWDPASPCCRQYACICDETKTCPGAMCPPTSDTVVVNEADGETLCCDEFDCKSARCEYNGKIYEANVTWEADCMYYRCILNETTSIWESVNTSPVACPEKLPCPDERYVHVENTSYEHECCKDYYCECKYANVDGGLQTIGYEYDDPENPNCYRMKVVKREKDKCPETEREEKFVCEDEVECGDCEEKVKVRDDECCGAIYQCVNKTCPVVECTEDQKKVLMSNSSSCCDEYACICECKNVGTNFAFRYRCRKRFSLIGNCTYLLSKDVENDMFQIYVKQGYCANLYPDEDYPANQKCYHMLKISYKTNNFECHMRTGRVFLNGNEIVRYNQYGVYMFRSLVNRGSIRYVSYLVIWLKEEGVIIFYRNPTIGQNPNAVATVDLYLTQRPKGTSGMCGSCDGNQEYECPSTGDLVTNEYTADATCLPPCGVGSSCEEDRCKYIEPCTSCNNCSAMDNSDPCVALNNPVFDECHEGMNMSDLYDQCYETQCYTTNDTETSVAAACNVCTSQFIQAHITECGKKGFCGEYQKVFGCDTTPGDCTGNQVYKQCVTPCEASKTCDDLNSSPSMVCSQGMVSLCTCPDGYVYRSSEVQECIKKECCNCPEPPVCDGVNYSPVKDGEDECGCPTYRDTCVCCPRCRNPVTNEPMEPGSQVDSEDGCSFYICPEYNSVDNPSCENQQVTTVAKTCSSEQCEAPYTPRYINVPGYCCPKVECVCPEVDEPECLHEYQVKKQTEGECPKPICVCECPVLAPNCTDSPGCKVKMNNASSEGCKCVDSWDCVPNPEICPAEPECGICHTAVSIKSVPGEGKCDAGCNQYQCQPKPCPQYFAPTLPCPRYYKEITEYASDDGDRCCPMSKCECKPVPDLQKECPQWDFSCPEDYVATRTNSEDECCPEYECVCNTAACPPAIDCDYKVLVTTNPLPGATGSHQEVCCPTYNCTCEGVVCPTASGKPSCSPYEKLISSTSESNECCTEYSCVCDPSKYPTDLTLPKYKPDDDGKCSLPGQDPESALDSSECFSRCVCLPEDRWATACTEYKAMISVCKAPKYVKTMESPEDDLDYICCPKTQCVCPNCAEDYVTKEEWESKRKPGQIVVPVDPPTPCCQPYQLVCDPDADESEYCFQFFPTCDYGYKAQRQPKDADCCPTYKCVCDESLCDSPPDCPAPKVRTVNSTADQSCCAVYKCTCPPDPNVDTTCTSPKVEVFTESECPQKRCVCPEHCPKGPTMDCTNKPGCRAVPDAKDECQCPLNYTCIGNPEPCENPPTCSPCAYAKQVDTVLVVGECNSTCPKYECTKRSCPAYDAPELPCPKYQQEVSYYDDRDVNKCCPKQMCECKQSEELKELCDQWYDMECKEHETKTNVGMQNGTNNCCPAINCVKPPCVTPEGVPFTGDISYEYEDQCCTRTCVEKDGKAEMKVNCFVQTCYYTCDDEYRQPRLKQSWQKDAPCCRDYDCICDIIMCPVMMCTPATNLTLVKKADGIEVCCDEYECKSVKCIYRGEYYEPDATWTDECSLYTCLYNDTSSKYEAENQGYTPCPVQEPCMDERYELVEDVEQNDPCCKSYHCECKYYLVNGTQQEIGYEYDDPENPNCYRMKVVKREKDKCPETEREEKFVCEDEVECGDCEDKVKVRDDECCGAVYQCVNQTCPVVNCTEEQKKVFMSNTGCCDEYKCVCECKDLSTTYAFRYRCRQRFHLDGDCSYLLTKDIENDRFEIYVKQSFCKDIYPDGIYTGYQMCYEKLTIRYKTSYFEFFLVNGKVFHNGNEVSNYNQYSVGVFRFLVKRDGVQYVSFLYLVLKNEGLIILYRNPDIGKNPNAIGIVDLYLTSRPKGTTGACGSCDGKPEYECPSFSELEYTQDSECPPPCDADLCDEERCKYSKPCIVCRNCSYYGYNDPCDALDNVVFESCNSGEDRADLLARCREEQCFSENDTASAIEAQCNVCSSLFIQRRVTHCNNNGHCKDYQVELDCDEGKGECKSHEEFQTCINSCEAAKTCDDINEKRVCATNSSLVSACTCPDGYYYKDENQETCVEEKCCDCPPPPQCEEGPNFAPVADGADNCLCPNYTGECYCCPYCKNPDTGELINPGKSVPTPDGCGVYICPEHDPETNPDCLTLNVITKDNPCPASKCKAPRTSRYTTSPGHCCPDEECICPEVEKPTCELKYQKLEYTEGECPKPICVCECPVLAPNCTDSPGCKVKMNNASSEGCKCVDSWDCVPAPELCPVKPECGKCHDLKVVVSVPGESKCDAQCDQYQCVPRKCQPYAIPGCSNYQLFTTYYLDGDENKCCPREQCECKPNADLKGICEQWFDLTCGDYRVRNDLGWQEGTNDCCPAYECVCDSTRCPTTICKSTEDLIVSVKADGDQVCCNAEKCESARCLYDGKHYEPNATWVDDCSYFSCQYNISTSLYETSYDGEKECPVTEPCPDDRYVQVEDTTNEDICCEKYNCECKYANINGSLQTIGYEYDDPENPNCYRMKVVKREKDKCPETEREEKFVCEDEVECGDCEEKVKVRDDECCGAVYQCVDITCPEVTCDEEDQEKVFVSNDTCCDKYECRCKCKDLGTSYSLRFRCRQQFKLNGNCTYMMARESENGRFEISVKQSHCSRLYPTGIYTDYQLCYEIVTILYKNNRYELFPADEKVLLNGNEITDRSHYCVKVSRGYVKRGSVKYIVYLVIWLTEEGTAIVYRNPDIGKNFNAIGIVDLYLAARQTGTTGVCGSCGDGPGHECPTFSSLVTNEFQQDSTCLPPCDAEHCDEERCKNSPPCIVCRNCSYFGYKDPCDVLGDPVFSSCSNDSERAQMRDLCQQEQCYSENETESVIAAQCDVCKSMFIQQYVTHCQKEGSCKNYQKALKCEDGEVTCSGNEIYKECIDACDASKTCTDLTIKRDETVCNMPVSTCTCPDGYVYRSDEKKECVKEECCSCPDPPVCEEGANYSPVQDGTDSCGCKNYTETCVCCPRCRNPVTNEPMEPGTQVDSEDGCSFYICPEYNSVDNPSCENQQVTTVAKTCSSEQCEAPYTPRYINVPGYCCPKVECVCPEVDEPECLHEYQVKKQTEGECPKPICVCECPVLAPNCTDSPGCKVKMNNASSEGCKCVDSWECVPAPELCPAEPECGKCHDVKVIKSVPGESKCDAQCDQYQCVPRNCPSYDSPVRPCPKYHTYMTEYAEGDTDECCPIGKCVCKPNFELQQECPYWTDYSCDLGWKRRVINDVSDCCPRFECVCDYNSCGSAPNCDYKKLVNYPPLNYGTHNQQCCNSYDCTCEGVECEGIEDCSQYKKLVSEKDEENDCCPIQTCVCDPDQYPAGHDDPEIKPSTDGSCARPGQMPDPEYDDSGCLAKCVCYPPGELPSNCPQYGQLKADCSSPKYIVATEGPSDNLDYVCCPLYKCVCPDCGEDYVTKEELEADLGPAEIVVPDGEMECCQRYVKVCRPDACCSTYKCVCPPNNFDNVTCELPKVAAYSKSVCPKKYCECPDDCNREATIDCTDKPGCRPVVTNRDVCGCALNSTCKGDPAPCDEPPTCPDCYSPIVVDTKLVVGDCNSTCNLYKCTRNTCPSKKKLPPICTFNSLAANYSDPCCPVTEINCVSTCPREKCKEGYHAELTDEYWSDDYNCAPGLKCCPKEKCVCDVCFYKEKPFKVGERWHPGDSCNVLTCTGTRTGDCYTITEREPHCLYTTDNGTEIVLSAGGKMPVTGQPCKSKVCRISADCVETIEDYTEICPPPTQCNAFQFDRIEHIAGVCCPKTSCICKECEPDHDTSPEGESSEHTVLVNQTLDENPNQVCCPRSKYDCAGPEVLSHACPQWNKTCPLGKERLRTNEPTKCCPEYICVCKQDCNYKMLNPPLEHPCHERMNKTVDENPIQECCPASYVLCMEDKNCCGSNYETYNQVKENLKLGEEIAHNEDSHECCPLYEPVCKNDIESDPVCAPYRPECEEGYKEQRMPDDVGCCPAFSCVCDETKCPVKPVCESPKELKLTGASDPCCNTYDCVCPPDVNATAGCVPPEQVYKTKSVCPTSYCRCPESLECPVNADVENCRTKTGCRPEVTGRDACDCVTNSTCVYDPSLCPPKKECDTCYQAVSDGPLPGVGECQPTCESYTCKRTPCPYTPKPEVCELEQVYTNYDGCCESYTVKCKTSACPKKDCADGYELVIDNEYVDVDYGCTNELNCCRRERCVCKVCNFKNSLYDLGETWTDPDEPCAQYECSNDRNVDLCYVPKRIPPKCEHEGSSYPPGAIVKTNNPCIDLLCVKVVADGTCTYRFDEKRKTCPGMPDCPPYHVPKSIFHASECCPTYECVCEECGEDYENPADVREPEWYEVKLNRTLDENPNQGCCPMVKIVCDDTQLHKCQSEQMQCDYGEMKNQVESEHPCCPAYECVCKECREHEDPRAEDLKLCEAIVEKNNEENPNSKCCPEKKVICQDAETCCPVLKCGEYEVAKPTGVMDGCCPTYECVCKPTEYLSSECPFANFTCPIGFKPYRNNSIDECCAEYGCKCVACVVNGVAYPVGVSWKDSEDHCTMMECYQEEPNCPATRSSQRYTCEPVNETECSEAGGQLFPTTKTEGCCQACKMCTPEDNFEEIKIVSGVNGDGEDVVCVSEEKVNVPTCTGACKTTSIYNVKTNAFESKCRCCMPSHSQKKQVSLSCNDGFNYNYQYDYVVECGCHETTCQK